MRGKVKWFSEKKGYGFIVDSEKCDRFFHVSQINGPTPDRGDIVDFKPADTPKGRIATEVTVIQKNINPLHQVIKLGDVRLKLRNIHSYHIETRTKTLYLTREEAEEFDKEHGITNDTLSLSKLPKPIRAAIGTSFKILGTTLLAAMAVERAVSGYSNEPSKEEVYAREIEYDVLLVNTYDQKTYAFTENIEEYVEKLDAAFNSL